MLVQKITYFTNCRKNKNTEIIASATNHDCNVLPNSQRKFSQIQIKIPPTCPSLMETCSIIKNNYELKIKVDGSGLSVGMCLSIPIEIGTVPFLGGKVSTTDIFNVDFQPRNFHGVNNDRETKIGNFINFYDPLYPVYTHIY